MRNAVKENIKKEIQEARHKRDNKIINIPKEERRIQSNKNQNVNQNVNQKEKK